VNDDKKRLEEQLKTAVSWKTELDNRIHDMHLQFVKSPGGRASTLTSTPKERVNSFRVQYENAEEEEEDVKRRLSRSENNLPRNPAPLPSLPVSLPVGNITVSPNRRKISQVLQEKDILSLKKQLLLYIQAYEVRNHNSFLK
jgi:hypothetical protein